MEFNTFLATLAVPDAPAASSRGRVGHLAAQYLWNRAHDRCVALGRNPQF